MFVYEPVFPETDSDSFFISVVSACPVQTTRRLFVTLAMKVQVIIALIALVGCYTAVSRLVIIHLLLTYAIES